MLLFPLLLLLQSGSERPDPAPPPVPPAPRLVRAPLDEETVRELFHLWPPDVYDPEPLFRYAPNLELARPYRDGTYRTWFLRTNSLGFRDDDEPLEEQPDLRVLVTGDAHAEGVNRNSEALAHRLELRLARRLGAEARVQCHNAAHGGYSFYNYLGVLERWAELEPHVFVVLVYGGNDFEEVLTLAHHFRGSQRPSPGADAAAGLEVAKEIETPSLSQVFLSLRYFALFPDQRELAHESALAATLEMQRLGNERGTALVVAYLPSPLDVQPRLFEEFLERQLEALGLEETDLEISDRMGSRYVEALREHGVRVVDLRATLAAEKEPAFWPREWHLSLVGHAAAGRALVDTVHEAAASLR